MKKILVINIFLLFGFNISAQILSISEIQGQGASTPFNNQIVSTRGAITGIYKDGYFIRDSEYAWGGMYIYDPGRDPMPRLGDTLIITGTVTEYYDWTEMKTITEYEVQSTGNPEPQPVILTAEEVNESWESCLIKVENLICTNDNLGYGEWEVDDGTASLVVNDLGVSYTPDLGQKYTITGHLSYSFGAYKIEPRSINDIQIMAPVFFIEGPYASDIQKTEITVGWTTNTESTTELQWGYTPDLEMGSLSIDEAVINHTISLSNLNPATIVYARFFSVIESDTAISSIQTYISASESSGEMRVSFNRTYTDQSFIDSPEIFTHYLADSIANYILKAKKTVDLALYDFTDHSSQAANYQNIIISAINQAASNGVKVRLITDADVANAAPQGQEVSYPRFDVDQDGIMHHKFIIIDHENPDSSWILSGSTNPNYNNLVLDFNNLIAIQDQSLAKAYLIEFNELWGSEGMDPDPTNSRSGANKTDNSPHQFNINGKKVELYFSPSDHTTSQIAKQISEAEATVDFAIMAFTENVLGDAIVAANNNGAIIGGTIDYVEYSGSEFNYLIGAGLDVLDYSNPDESGWPDGPTVHHKFAVVDAGHESARVITGSHNWTASAESRNDENTLIIHDQTLADLYKLESDRIRGWLLDPPLKPDAIDDYYELNEEHSLILDITTNDNIIGEIELEIIQPPKLGTATELEDLSIEYTPNAEFTSTSDTLIYLVSIKSYPQFKDSAMVIIHKTSDNVVHRELSKQILIYPNPVENFINIDYTGEIYPELIQVLDVSGKTIFETRNVFTENPLKINMQDMKSGIYLVKIYSGDMVITRKIVKK